MSGSSNLTAEQTDWYEERFGVRMLSVQENHVRPSRRVRRALKHGSKRNACSPADVATYEAQAAAQKRLTESPLSAVAVKGD